MGGDCETLLSTNIANNWYLENVSNKCFTNNNKTNTIYQNILSTLIRISWDRYGLQPLPLPFGYTFTDHLLGQTSRTGDQKTHGITPYFHIYTVGYYNIRFLTSWNADYFVLFKIDNQFSTLYVNPLY